MLDFGVKHFSMIYPVMVLVRQSTYISFPKGTRCKTPSNLCFQTGLWETLKDTASPNFKWCLQDKRRIYCSQRDRNNDPQINVGRFIMEDSRVYYPCNYFIYSELFSRPLLPLFLCFGGEHIYIATVWRMHVLHVDPGRWWKFVQQREVQKWTGQQKGLLILTGKQHPFWISLHCTFFQTRFAQTRLSTFSAFGTKQSHLEVELWFYVRETNAYN